MIISATTRAYVCAQPVDMRKSIDALAQLVEPLFQASPFSGHVFVFLGKTRNKAKLLVWDRHGFWLLYKRLERSQFPKPETLAQRGLSGAELMAFLDGIDVSKSTPLKSVSATRIS
jgi:transposase